LRRRMPNPANAAWVIAISATALPDPVSPAQG
jgi:hypothetical protein